MKAKHDFVVGGIEGMSYSEYSFTLKKGASLFLYTDGVPEAANKNNELYGTERMLNALNAAKDLTPHKLLRSVRADISEFVGTAPQFDDLTMMCIRYNGPA
jgi:sigma-B regulation protein RsbU (phosphoserine phosphatase)